MIIISEAGIHTELAIAQAMIGEGQSGQAYRILRNRMDAAIMYAAIQQAGSQSKAAELLGVSRATIRATLNRVTKETELLNAFRNTRPTVAAATLTEQQGGAA